MSYGSAEYGPAAPPALRVLLRGCVGGSAAARCAARSGDGSGGGGGAVTVVCRGAVGCRGAALGAGDGAIFGGAGAGFGDAALRGGGVAASSGGCSCAGDGVAFLGCCAGGGAAVSASDGLLGEAREGEGEQDGCGEGCGLHGSSFANGQAAAMRLCFIGMICMGRTILAWNVARQGTLLYLSAEAAAEQLLFLLPECPFM